MQAFQEVTHRGFRDDGRESMRRDIRLSFRHIGIARVADSPEPPQAPAHATCQYDRQSTPGIAAREQHSLGGRRAMRCGSRVPRATGRHRKLLLRFRVS